MPIINLPKYTFINGPPGSGNITLAELLCKNDLQLYRESFANPIRDMMYAVFYPEEGPISFSFDLRHTEAKKAFMKVPDKSPMTNRAAMISFSECWMKPIFGEEIFGRLALARCKEQEDFYERFVFDDSGFAPEAQYIISTEGGPKDFLLLRLHREGSSFSGDSRSYIELPGVHTIDLTNNSSPDHMLSELELFLGKI